MINLQGPRQDRLPIYLSVAGETPKSPGPQPLTHIET
jgi:hypothetical protein